MTDREQLEILVRKANRFRDTPVVDDDFPAMRNDFDYELKAAGAHLKRARRTVVCLCGSTRFYRQFQEANYAETMAGKVVLSVGHYPHSSEQAHSESVGCTPEQKVELDKLHCDKIDIADEVLVLNVGGYVGDSTRREVLHAAKCGRSIRWLEPDKIPADLQFEALKLAS